MFLLRYILPKMIMTTIHFDLNETNMIVIVGAECYCHEHLRKARKSLRVVPLNRTVHTLNYARDSDNNNVVYIADADTKTALKIIRLNIFI